jgi:tetratricopeptide (TPR) repeat protein
MLTSLLITELSRSPGLQVVSSQRLFDIARRLGREDVPVDRSVATDIATRAGVGSMLVGQVARTRDGLVATTELVDVKTGELLGSYRATGRTEDDIFSVAQTLGQEVRRRLHPVQGREVTSSDLARTLTQSVEAYRAYVRGEARMTQSDYDRAASEFRQAVRFDPEFALAYYFLGEAACFGGHLQECQEATLRALGLEDKLPASYRDLVRARALPPASPDRVPLLEKALELDQSNAEPLMLLSEEYAHSGRHTDPERAAGFRERLFQTGHYQFALLEEQATTLALLGRPDRAEEIVAESEARWPALAPYTRAWLSAFAGQVDAALKHIEQATAPAPVTSIYVLSEVPEIAGRWDLAERAVSRDPGESRWRARDLRLRGQFLVHRGAFDRAVQAYRQAVEGARLEEGSGFTASVWASVFSALAELEALRGDSPAARRAMADALVVQPECPRWLCFAGRLAARARDLGAAQQYLDALRRTTPTTQYVTRDLYRDALEAEILLASGRPDAALPLAEKVATSPRRVQDYWLDAEFASPVFHETLVHTYLTLGRKADAARALERLVNSGLERVHHPAIYVPALYTLGTLKIELGDKVDGERLLRRFLDHWGQASWDLKEFADARRRLSR